MRDTEAYENRAIHLARHPAELRKVKNRLAGERMSSPLFDTQRFTDTLETVFEKVWRHYIGGMAPRNYSPKKLKKK
jgi:predicted O-linked N-acetylglucosamine transferase (SPINDLY family)